MAPISRCRGLALALFLLTACAPHGLEPVSGEAAHGGKSDGWADGWEAERRAERELEVVLNDPHCDVCTPADKAVLHERSRMIARVVALVGEARETIDVAQYTFSVTEIEEALVAAHASGVRIRVAIDRGQDRPGSVARSLRDAGLDVRFVGGRPSGHPGRPDGLQHAKFMIVDGATLITGSNNWSSTGTTFNEENAIVVRAGADDPQIAAFACHFDTIWESDLEAAGACSTDDVTFTPGTAPIAMLKESIGGAQHTVDVLMHHLNFGDLVKELAKVAEDPERRVRVRVIANAADRGDYAGGVWDRLRAAGGEIRFKRTDPGIAQLMHHKLVIVDGRVLVNGSGNWSGAAFFNNYENFVRYRDPRVVRPFRGLFERLWTWSLDDASLDHGRNAADQHFTATRAFFGNLHAHYTALEGDALLDDGLAQRADEAGESYPVEVGAAPEAAARFAFEYARDRGGLDYLVLSPHTVDDRPEDPADIASMSEEVYAGLGSVAGAVTRESEGAFLAVAGMEWSTNSVGNHVNVFGSRALAKVERGRFDLLWDGFLPEREWEGDRPLVMLNHPRTFRVSEEYLTGSWDQIFGVSLLDIPNDSQRRQKFNDYGLDDFPPLSGLLGSWIAGEVAPDEGVVAETFARLRDASAPYARLMEVAVGRGKEIAHEAHQNPSLSENEVGETERFTRVHRDWDHYLLGGFRLSPTASHDNHRANWGTGHSSRTVFFAERLGEGALLDAIERGEVYASEDENLELRFYADGRVPMGGEVGTLADSVQARAWVADPDHAGGYQVRVWSGVVGGDAVGMVSEHAPGADGWLDITLALPEPGTRFFYLEVWAPGPNRMAWSAPIWVTRLAATASE